MNIQCTHEVTGTNFEKGLIYRAKYVGNSFAVECKGELLDLKTVVSIGVKFKEVKSAQRR